MAKATKVLTQQDKDNQALRDMVDTWGKDYKSIAKRGHDIAARLVVHAVRYGDVSLASRFLSKMDEKGDGKSMARANMFKGWFERKGPFTWSKEAKGFKCNTDKRAKMQHHIKDNKTAAKFYSTLMKDVPWEKDKEPEYKGFDLDKQIMLLVKRAETAEKEHGKDPKTKLGNLKKFKKFVGTLTTAANANGDTEVAENDNAEAA